MKQTVTFLENLENEENIHPRETSANDVAFGSKEKAVCNHKTSSMLFPSFILQPDRGTVVKWGYNLNLIIYWLASVQS